MKILLVSVPHTLVVDLFFCAVISFYKIDLVEHPLSQLLGYSDHLLHNMWGPAGCSYELRAAWSISPLGQSGSDDALFLGLKRGWKWHTQIHSELSLAQCSPHFNNYCQPETLVLIFPLPLHMLLSKRPIFHCEDTCEICSPSKYFLCYVVGNFHQGNLVKPCRHFLTGLLCTYWIEIMKSTRCQCFGPSLC